METSYLFDTIIVGIGATLITDHWTVFLKRAFAIPSLSYCLVGRWIGHMAQGTFRHSSISAAPRKRFECTVGWVTHYFIGNVFALIFVFLVSGEWLAQPTLVPALLFGLGTVLFPFFIMQPSFGLGVAASRTPNPMTARLKSMMTHAVFGTGLYVCATGMRYLFHS